MTIVTRPTRRSSLCHPVPAHRADRQGEAAGCPVTRRPRHSLLFRHCASCHNGERAAGNRRSEPLYSRLLPVCRGADVALLYWVALIGLAAAVIALVRQMWAGVPC